MLSSTPLRAETLSLAAQLLDLSLEAVGTMGSDRLLMDATGQKVMPRGTQRVDLRWGASLIRETTGRIEDGVLTTEPLDDLVPPWMNLSVPSIHVFRDERLRLNLTPEGATVLLAGYADVDTSYYQLIRIRRRARTRPSLRPST